MLVLRGAHVVLRPFGSGDVDALLAAVDLGLASASERADERRRIERMVALTFTLVDDGFWPLAVEHDGELVGDIQARAGRYAFPPGVCELGLTLFPFARGRGIGTESVTLLAEHLQPTWPRVQSTTAETNVAMRRVLERAGFTYEGTLAAYAPDELGGRETYVMYARTPQ